MEDKLARLTRHGQWIGDVPKGRAVEFLRLLHERFPDHEYAVVGDGEVSLVVYPPLDHDELEAWESLCERMLRANGEVRLD